MPTHCCVPGCVKKGYSDEDGNKVSYFIFPVEKGLRKKWIHAIRRDEGKDFQIKPTTKVCSRHFRENDIKKTLAGKFQLRAGAVPSLFSWTRTSPRKRKAPTHRECGEASAALFEASEIAEPEEQSNTKILEDKVVASECDNSNDVAACAETQTNESQAIEMETKEFMESMDNSQELTSLKEELSKLTSQLENMKRQNELLQSQLFNIERFRNNDSAINFYTGFPNWNTFMAVIKFMDPGDSGENIRYWLSSNVHVSADFYEKTGETESKRGRSRTLRPIDEYFLVLCRLRQGFREEHLAHLFQISTSTVSRILITWINFMYLKLGQINIWPSRDVIDKTMPEDFKVKYRSTRAIIDCTEVRCQMPSSLHLNGELFSNYKHHTTLKSLIGISPGGAITFISQLYTGSISDREIVVRSGFLDLPFQDNDSVMADKGFTVQDLLPLGVSLNIPPFLGSSSQMPADDVIRTQEIASLRIHVERAINKIKNFHVWDGVIPLHQFGIVNQMWTVCALLVNAQSNIISV